MVCAVEKGNIFSRKHSSFFPQNPNNFSKHPSRKKILLRISHSCLLSLFPLPPFSILTYSQKITKNLSLYLLNTAAQICHIKNCQEQIFMAELEILLKSGLIFVALIIMMPPGTVIIRKHYRGQSSFLLCKCIAI